MCASLASEGSCSRRVLEERVVASDCLHAVKPNELMCAQTGDIKGYFYIIRARARVIGLLRWFHSSRNVYKRKSLRGF